jgi:hypothetical protein
METQPGPDAALGIDSADSGFDSDLDSGLDTGPPPDGAEAADAAQAPPAGGWFWEVRPPRNAIHDVWASGPSDVWAVGEGGLLLHFDGERWTEVEAGVERRLREIWGATSDDIYVAMESSELLHFDGRNWSPVQTGASQALMGVTGTSATDVWAVGHAGQVLRFDGQTWTSPSTEGVYLRKLRASPSGEIYGTGTVSPDNLERLFRFDGSGWVDLMAPRYPDGGGWTLVDVWAGSPSSVYAAGSGLQTSSAVLLHFDGMAWNKLDVAGGVLVGSGEDDFHVLGTLPRRWDGGAFTELPVFEPAGLIAGASVGRKELIAASVTGALYRLSDTTWSRVRDAPPPGLPVRLVHGIGEEAYALAVTAQYERVLLRRRPRIGWSVQPAPELSATDCLWMLAPDDLHLVDHDGRHRRFHRGIWSEVAQLDFKCTGLWSVDGALYAVGHPPDYQGVVAIFDGQSWRRLAEGPGMVYSAAIWASGPQDIVVAHSNQVHRYDGARWSTTRLSEAPSYERPSIWGSGSDDIFLAIDTGLFRWDGGTWRETTPWQNGPTYFRAVAGVRRDSVFALGSGGLFHWDGRSWRAVEVGTPPPLASVWASGSGEVYLFGISGGILRGYAR